MSNNFNYRSFDDMATCIRNNVTKLPVDLDLIVGIPRSGMIPAYMIALFLNKKACSIDEFINGIDLSSGYSREVNRSQVIKKVLIVDDSIHSGVALSKTKDKISKAKNLKNIEIKYLAIYAREQSVNLVDYYFEIVPSPRLFQWNYLNININERSCFDIDGVLCVDPTPEENDDGEKYKNFILNVRPLFVPKYKIKAIVTSRLEKYREETEYWLKKNGVEYEHLYMLDLPNKEARVALGAHANFKAKIYAQTKTELFIESEPKQAAEIARLSGKPCICVSNDKYYAGDGICKINIFDFTEYKRRKGKKRILLYSHEFTYTGAPHSLLRICKVLRDKYYIEVWGPEYGDFVKEFEELGIKVCIVPYELLEYDFTVKAIKSFDFAIANTLICHRFYRAASKYIPTAWYIREATNIPDICKGNPDREALLRSARDLYCVSEYAQKFIADNYNKRVKVLRNCMEDYSELAVKNKKNNKVSFLQIGTLGERKGFKEYVEAFMALPQNLQNKAHLYFAGRLMDERKDYWEPILEKIKGNKNITYLGEITDFDKKIEIYNNIDIFVVASYDESCSLVVLEGAMLSKPLIVTENVGAKYMVSDKNGIIVKTKDINTLSDAFKYFIINKNKIKAMGKASREAYEKYATMELYSRNINNLINKFINKNKTLYRISTEIRNFLLSSSVIKFIAIMHKDGLRAALYKSKRFLINKMNRSKRISARNYKTINLWGTSASKIAIDRCVYAKVGIYVGKQSIISACCEPFKGDVNVVKNNKDIANIIGDIKKSSIERISSNKSDYIVIDLLDEKFNLVKFNGRYVISASDAFNRNKSNILIDGVSFEKKQLLKYNITEQEINTAVVEFCNKVKKMYDEKHIILHEAYFAVKYKDKYGVLKSFAKGTVESFEEKNNLLKKLYEIIKKELPHCHVIDLHNYILSDELHVNGLSTMHFTDKYYNMLANKITKIIK